MKTFIKEGLNKLILGGLGLLFIYIIATLWNFVTTMFYLLLQLP